MKIILLVAGKGSRLYPLTKDIPKSLIQMNDGKSILDKQLEAIEECGVKDVVLITGYRSHMIEEKVKDHPSMNLKIIFNPFYDISNNLMSLWFAHQEFNDDVIIINGDNLFHADALKKLVDEQKSKGMCMVISKKPAYDDDDMKVKIQGDRVVEVSKKIAKDEAHAESVGMIKIHKEGRETFGKILDTMARDKENINVFWLHAIQKYMNGQGGISYLEIPAEHWFEMDFHHDFSMINHLLGLRYQNLDWICNEKKGPQ